MSAPTANFIEDIERLTAGDRRQFSGVGWEDYEQLLAELGEGYNLRVNYDGGKLEVMSPLPEHEEYKDIIHDLLRTLARALGLRMETRGSATLKRQLKAKGAEPDGCYWIQNAARLIGKRKIDLNTDPPPDLVVEIDLTHQSMDKLPIYAALGVPEVWRYEGSQAHFYKREGEVYVEVAASVAFPMLTVDELTRFIELSKASGQDAAIDALRAWVISI